MGKMSRVIQQFLDHPVELADAWSATAADVMNGNRVFTLDLGDFQAYRVRRGHRRSSATGLD
jgi:hypothetical protein